MHNFSSKIYENINKLNPKNLWFVLSENINNDFDYIDILSNISWDIKTSFIHSSESECIRLEFKNAFIKVTEFSKQKDTFIYWKSLQWNINPPKIDDEFFFLHQNDNKDIKENAWVVIKYSVKITFEGFKVITDYEEISKLKDLFQI